MIFEIEDETRDFLTIYKKDYYSKKGERSAKYKPVQNFEPPLNALNGPYKNYLNTRKQNELLSPEERTEDPQDNLNRIRNEFPHLNKILLETAPNEDVVEKQRKKLLNTVYHVDYSRDLDDYLPLHRRRIGVKKVKLPEKWTIQETIQRQSYRNPHEIISADLLRVEAVPKPLDNLTPNSKQRKILRITTGNSEYGGVIGNTGDRIMGEHLLGIPPPLKPPSIIFNDSDSKCSRILSTPIDLPSNVL